MAFKKLSGNKPPKKTACQSGCCSPASEPSIDPKPAATLDCCPPPSPAVATEPGCSCCSEEPPVRPVAEPEPACECCTGADAVSTTPALAACDCCTDTVHPVGAQTTPSKASTLTSTFTVDGLDCADCAAKLEKGINKLTGVMEANVNFATAKLKVIYDQVALQPAQIEKAVSSFGYQAALIPAAGDPASPQQSVFQIAGLDCGDCAAKLEKRVAALAGVVSAKVNFAAGKMTIEHTTPVADILQAVKQAGYQAERLPAGPRRPEAKAAWWANRRTQATLVSGVILGLATVLEWLSYGDTVLIPLYVAAAVIGGYNAAKSGLYGLRSLTFDMNFLMTVAVIGAAAIGEWSEGATVAFLFSFGNTLQTYTMDKTRQSIRALMELAPPEALVRRDGVEEKLPVEEIVIGDIIIVKPGERIAMDGIVNSGLSAVNQATITGESLPVEKATGDTVYAGTVNEHGALEIEVTQIAANSTLAKIMHLVEEAQAQKAPSQQFVDIFAKYYTPAVLLVAAGIMVLPWLLFHQPFTPWFYKGLVLLVISCPCALVISTPVSIVSAIGNSSRNGVLIKGGAYLEQMGGVQAIAFDKTGTLTHGRPVVTEIVPLAEKNQQELLSLAAAVEKWSEHPLAVAIVEKAKPLPLQTATKFKALVGRGAQADVNGQTVFVGNRRLFEELGLSLKQTQAAMVQLEEQGKTVMLIGSAQTLWGLIAVADTLRDNSKDAIRKLRQAGMKHIAMLTGDNSRVASSIAKTLTLDAYYSDLLPQDKVATVQRLTQEYGTVVMVGDGVNDAPALAAANVGVAMGVAGSDTALETADIALMADDLGKLAYVINLSRKTVAVIKQNIGFSVLIKILFVILTFFGYVDLWLAVLADMGSSILVTLNGMRLMQRIH
ncbi:cadmium-translocating P-type ATPase|uniref:Copper-exporting P-type ATPase n=1 Tax=Dendrosporobacter quercicolus TaxID=146817 RepID=A0A1G9X7P5_9FIRM|nr:heavy metal translocating P-type ATPase [Dendrosporobacter quercicolus]NSL49929.1 cadmium-translocating P-type ATPase [Dendrosporobacter quercicolus DSM 1736]SDM92496.1 Cd2+/Zn2+-exporting ATPase [Dendrosporobacter quercicolus]